MSLDKFIKLWSESAIVSLGLFWMAFWAFCFGYFVSSMIQVFITEKRIQKTMGKAGVRSIALGTFFGFVSSSCSFAALSTTRALFSKGAGLIPSLAFLLASTNLVIELGIVISIFLSWQFVVGEYLGGILLILLMTLAVKITLPQHLEKKARENAKNAENHDGDRVPSNWRKLFFSKKGWMRVSTKYFMEWQMVWKDVSIGFTVAGIIAAFVPQSFFEIFFIGSNSPSPSFLELFFQSLVGPGAAFFTFIGSMGNIPLAAVLFSNGVSFAGIMAFIFSDLIVFPVLRIQSRYYGWKMALYLLAVFLGIIVTCSLMIHYSFFFAGILPDPASTKTVIEKDFFKANSTLYLNSLFLLVSILAIFMRKKSEKKPNQKKQKHGEILLSYTAWVAFTWLGGGLLVKFLV